MPAFLPLLPVMTLSADEPVPPIPLVPVTAPGPAAVAALEPFVPLYDVVLIAGNGAFAWGDSVEQAYLRLELCEHLARIALLAEPDMPAKVSQGCTTVVVGNCGFSAAPLTP